MPAATLSRTMAIEFPDDPMNPLLRFDGYYILGDLLQIQNLRQRGQQYLANLIERAIILARGPVLELDHDLRPAPTRGATAATPTAASQSAPAGSTVAATARIATIPTNPLRRITPP